MLYFLCGLFAGIILTYVIVGVYVWETAKQINPFLRDYARVYWSAALTWPADVDRTMKAGILDNGDMLPRTNPPQTPHPR
jgi:hypothetical protein